MPRKKMIRYRDLAKFDNVHEGLEFKYKDIFNNDNPITLELACGRGEYTNGLAQQFPNQNFVGIDIKGERIWQAATQSHELNLSNTAFIRGSIDMLENFFENNSIDTIWIIHPDPQPKRERQRLTHPKYLHKYNNLLVPGGQLNLKTDDQNFFDYSLETISKLFTILKQTKDLHNSKHLEDHHGIITNFEQKALLKKKSICYLSASNN